MEKGMSFYTSLISEYLSEETKLEIGELVSESEKEPLTVPTFEAELKDYYEMVKIKDGETIRRYTSYQYKAINAVLIPKQIWNKPQKVDESNYQK